MASKKIIHIGFPKTGSTFLEKYFGDHPEIHHDRQRFGHYVKTGIVDNRLTQCEEGFAFDLLSDDRLSIWPGDDSEEDLSKYNINYNIKEKQKETAKSLKRLFPDAKVLIVVRRYPSLIPSLYSQYLLGGGTVSFSRILQKLQHDTLEMYDYDYTIGIYRNLFGMDNVLVMPFELLSDDPVQYLEHLERFFGFPHFNFPTAKVHASLNTHSVQVVRGINFLALAYIKLGPKRQRKKKILSYLEWLYNYKPRLNQRFKLGKDLLADEAELKVEKFRKTSTLVRFKSGLKKYDVFYE